MEDQNDFGPGRQLHIRGRWIKYLVGVEAGAGVMDVEAGVEVVGVEAGAGVVDGERDPLL